MSDIFKKSYSDKSKRLSLHNVVFDIVSVLLLDNTSETCCSVPQNGQNLESEGISLQH